jgi:basic amino acid/polyamine antiporter, APA family
MILIKPNDGKMGLWMTTAFVIGSVIGVAIFMLPVALAPLGINAVVAWIVSSCGAICLGLPLARLARGGAGIQTAIEETFGPTIGFMVTFAFWVSNWAGVAAIAVGAASTISRVVPPLANPLSVALLSVAFIIMTVPVNARGARASGLMAILTVLLRIVPITAVVILVAIKATAHEPLQPLWTQPLRVSAVATATALTLFAFTGFENVSAPVKKVRDSERMIPRGLLIGMAAVAFLYLMSSTSVMLLLPADQLARSPAPFADAVAAPWGESVASLMVVGIAISAFGCIGCNAMAGGELGYSMALKGDLPKALAWTNSRGAPVLAQVLSAGLATVLVLSNASRSTAGLFTFIILVSTVAVLILYVVAALATGVRERAAGTRALVVAGIIFSAYAFYGSGLEASLWGFGLAASGLPVRAMSRWLNGSSLPAEAIPIVPPGSSS